VVEPTSRLLARPEIPERRRFCAVCAAPVGRGHAGVPGRTRGFCPNCRTTFSFVPELSPGDVVGGHTVVGCLAHGGQGWIYLARAGGGGAGGTGRPWVVLKGGRAAVGAPPGNPRGGTARGGVSPKTTRLLRSVEHDAIVRTLGHVEHGGVGYLVMDYVEGRSLRSLLAARRAANGGAPDPPPVRVGVGYLLRLLPAFDYLHRRGLLYCDAKPDNVMIDGETATLIDLGALRRVGQVGGPVHTTAGYDAPELAIHPPSVASDLYALGRLLAAAVLDFPGRASAFRYRLPSQEDDEVLARHRSLYRFLLRATAVDPAERFPDAAGMARALGAVGVGARTDLPRSRASTERV
jgi:serine/threonine-protein kinase PknG